MTIFGAGAVGMVGIASIVLGIILMIVWNFINPKFFKGHTLERRAHTAD